MPFPASARLTLRDLVLEDAEALFDVYGNPAVCEFLNGPARSPVSVRDLVRSFVYGQKLTPRRDFPLAVVENETNSVIGIVLVNKHDSRLASLGFALVQEQWGQGFGTEMAALGLEFAFDQLRVERVNALRATQNHASANVMDNVGMTFVEREMITINLANGDTELRPAMKFSISRADWAEARSPDLTL